MSGKLHVHVLLELLLLSLFPFYHNTSTHHTHEHSHTHTHTHKHTHTHTHAHHTCTHKHRCTCILCCKEIQVNTSIYMYQYLGKVKGGGYNGSSVQEMRDTVVAVYGKRKKEMSLETLEYILTEIMYPVCKHMRLKGQKHCKQKFLHYYSRTYMYIHTHAHYHTPPRTCTVKASVMHNVL